MTAPKPALTAAAAILAAITAVSSVLALITPGPVRAEASATASPAASGYVTLTDPLEKAFTVEVPAGWRSEAGLARRSALEVNPDVRSLSPDKMTYLLIGEPTMPMFSPPQVSNAIGYREGKLYDSGLGGLALVMHYIPGAAFARYYGETAPPGLCPGFKLAGMKRSA